MIWHKSWVEARWRFLIGLFLLMCSSTAVRFAYPRIMELLPLVPSVNVNSELGRRIREQAELVIQYRGYVWSQWFRQNLPQIWTIFAAVLGSGGLLARSADAALFTLSLPVSRERWVAVRAAAGLAELFVMALVPSLLIPLLSPAVGQTYDLRDTAVHSTCVFLGGAVFFSMAFALSTIFNDLWRPLLLVLAIAVVLAVFEPIFPGLSQYSVFRIMAAETYFRTGHLPWTGLLLTSIVSAALLYGAAINVARQDF